MFTGMVFAHLDTGYCWCCFGLKEHDSGLLFLLWKLADNRAANTLHYGVAEGGDDCVLSWAFHIHGIGTETHARRFLLGVSSSPLERVGRTFVRGMFLLGRSSPPERSSYNFIKVG